MKKSFSITCLSWLAAFWVAALAWPAQAFQVASLTPQGQVARVRQVVVKFDDPAVNFGNAKAEAPLDLNCGDPQLTKGSGRWLNDRSWSFDLDDDLPPGVSCSLQLRAGLRSVKGLELAGPSSFKFNTGGPFVQRIVPDPGQPIEEDQHFLLQLNGPATLASLQAHVWCAVEGLGERVAVRLVSGKDRSAMFKALGMDPAADRLNVATLACNRTLTPGTKMQLVFGKGVSTPAGTGKAPGGMSGVASGVVSGVVSGAAPGIANTVENRFDFRVREPFTATFSCERENANSGCVPIRPLSLRFSAPVAAKLLAGITLKSAQRSYAPVLDKSLPASKDEDRLIDAISFNAPFAEQSALTLTVPKALKDASGRSLQNADSFPLAVSIDRLPPLAKFSAAPFGVLERLAEPDGVALLPVTLRGVEPALSVKGLAVEARQSATTPTGGKVSSYRPSTDADIIAWFQKVQRYDNFTVTRRVARKDVNSALPQSIDPVPKGQEDQVQTRMVSLLQGQAGVKTLDLPAPSGQVARPFEVVGIPLPAGFHVVEIASPKLGTSLLDERHGAGRTMVVRTSALVTNLAVHFKLGRENAMAWVTTLDKGAPVANAQVRVSDCKGREVGQAVTNLQGLATLSGLSPEPPNCGAEDAYRIAYFVSARAAQPAAGGKGSVEDLAFTWTDWHRGIEPWRFNLPTSRQAQSDMRAHTILDRSLLRAGETVSMKHLLRSETAQGFGLISEPPNSLVLTHVGSGQEYPPSPGLAQDRHRWAER